MIGLLNYNLNEYIGSVSFCEETDLYLLNKNLNPIRIEKEKTTFIRTGNSFHNNDELMGYYDSLNELDVIEIKDSGRLLHALDQNKDDATLFITEKCNSNCIMCPYSESVRKNGWIPEGDFILEIARHFPDSLKHITITGGEPFMIKQRLFEVLKLFKERYKEQEILLLTNGRIFCIEEYVNKLVESAPNNLILGIPLHADNSDLHDQISQTKGSFNQTCSGITRLVKERINIEIRVVVSSMNYRYLEEIAYYIAKNFKRVFRVVFVGLEMVGNAAANKDRVWIPYSKSAPYIEKASMILINSGITTKIYNYPLCTVNERYWSICELSISDYKRTYTDTCEICRMRNMCGGVFNGTIRLEKNELRSV